MLHQCRDDKRAESRITVSCMVSFEVSGMVDDELRNRTKNGLCVDISSCGLGLLSDFPLAKKEVLKLHIPFDNMSANLPVFAVVIWSVPEEDGFRTGLRFLA